MSHSPSFSQPRAPMGGAGTSGRNPYANGQGFGAGASGRNPYANGQSFGDRTPNSNTPGAAAAGAGLANRNQPNLSNAGAAAAGAGLANRNQPNLSNAGAAAAGAGLANRNQPNLSNAGAAAAGAAYANRNPYNRYHPGLVNGYWNANTSAALYGAALAGGVAAWGVGSPMYAYGYSGYGNPYAGASNAVVGVPQGVPAQAGNAYDYAQPINTAAPPPEESVADQASDGLTQAMGAFKAGDYATALTLCQRAASQMPNDTNLHEFLALNQFAQGQYDQAAGPLYAVLSVGPGWDWTTLIGMYADAETYTRQLRALEAFRKANPQSAAAGFVLAYHYLCQGHREAAVDVLKDVVRLQPDDTLSAQLLATLQPSNAAPTNPPAPPDAPAVVTGNLKGDWVATSPQNATISLKIQEDSSFTWRA
ncbi:MAG: tetratricopeptide repeat protein, partial [Isosphaeraceae bacterium]